MPILMLVILLLSAPISAFVNALLYRVLWDNTLGAQFGAGPSPLSWYGISLFVSIMFYIGTKSSKPASNSDRKPKLSDLWPVLETFVTSCMLIGFAIVSAIFARAVLGW